MTTLPEPLISIVIPTRNRLPLLQRAMASVLDQTHRALEVIVIDDASDDGTEPWLRTLADPRVRYIRNRARRGAGHARHEGAAASSGAYVAFLDSDDYWLPEKLSAQLALAASAGDAPVVVLGYPGFVRSGELLPHRQPVFRPGRPLADFVYVDGGVLQTSTLLVKGDLARQIRFDPELRVNQDTDYLLRLERSGATILYHTEPMTIIDVSPRNDRITADPGLIDESLAWYRRVSSDWSPEAKRGFWLYDHAVRCGTAGYRLRGLHACLRGMHRGVAAPVLARKFLVAMLGSVPDPLRRLGRLPRRIRGHA